MKRASRETSRPSRARPLERRCDGILRRDVLGVGVLGAFGLTLADRFRLRAEMPRVRRPARSCILVWLDGGPSHLDTLDPKPEAPREVRGPFGTVATRVPGLHLSEYLVRTARVADRLTIIRSMTSPLGEHDFASHYMLTGYRPTPVIEYPSLGSVVSMLRAGERLLPPYIAVGDRANALAGAGYLPRSSGPFVIDGDPAKPGFRVRDLELYPTLTEVRLRRRRDYLRAIDEFSRLAEEAGAAFDPELEQAYRMVTSAGAKEAFDLSGEADGVRRRYGSRTIGASCLIARRLVERGVPFVTVTDRGWDTHADQYTRLKEGYTGGTVGKVPMLDQAFSALVSDLDARGLLEETLVILMGEFGRTPKINTRGGRDHWPRVFSVAFAGGGVPGGQVVGRSDAVGESPADRPVTPADLARTVFTILGIDPELRLSTPEGRPVAVNRDGRVIEELLG